MFINLTNHPSSGWSEEQLAAAVKYGEIKDISFPPINENAPKDEILRLADRYYAQILKLGEPQDLTVHIMGEQTFCYAIISKLQQAGIRCVASCTKKDSYVNEKGQKVSTFHFTQFREYEPSVAFCSRKRPKCSLGVFSKLPTKKPYSWTALTLVLVAEVLMLIFLRIRLSVLVGLVLLLLLLLFIRKLRGLTFSVRSTVSKLLANAISPTRLGTSFLLAFVIHIGWLGNAVHGLFSGTDAEFSHTLFSTIVCVVGLSALVLFFPDGKEEKNGDAKETILSAMSLISVPRSGQYSDLNLRPLVRVLEGRKIDNCELLILRSDYNGISDEDLSKSITGVMEFLFEHNKEDKDLASALLDGKTVVEQMEALIKKVAQIEFPGREEEIARLSIEWTDPCNYNVFKSCHDALIHKIEEKDDYNHRLICYVSPGTALVGALITLMAIDGDRELYYYSQEKNVDDSKRLMRVNKNDIPLKNLLSQALEKVESPS